MSRLSSLLSFHNPMPCLGNALRWGIAPVAMWSLLLSSCAQLAMSPGERHLQEALEMAGENRTEFEKVLSHYADDPQRLEAARWLISNMPLHHSKTGPELAKYRRYYETAADQTLNPQTVRDSLDSIYGAPDLSKLDIVYDIHTIDSAYLVENIDAAFEARERWPCSLSPLP